LSMPWFRLYNETVSDPKIQTLDLCSKWMWVTCLCVASAADDRGSVNLGNVPATFRELSNIAGIPFRAGEASIKKLLGRGLLADGESGGLVIPKWHQRQFSSDNSTSRTRKYKEKIKGDGTVRERSGNVPGTDQITDNRIQINNKDDADNLSPEDREILNLIDPYTMTPKEIQALRSRFNLDPSDILAAMSHPKAKTIKSAYLYLLNWFKRSAGKTQEKAPALTEFKSKVSRMFDEFASKWPNRDCLGEARKIFLSLFPEDEPREVARERAKRVNAHAAAYLSRTDPAFCMRLSKWLKSTEFDLSPEVPQPGPEYEVASNG